MSRSNRVKESDSAPPSEPVCSLLQFELNQAVNLRFSAKHHKCSVMRTPFFLQTIKCTLTPCILTKLHSCREFAQSLHTESAHLRCARCLIINQLMRPRCSLLTYLTTTCPSQSVINIRSCCRHRQNYQHRRQPGSTECSKTWFRDLVESNGAHQTIFSCS